jgi:hypothetical protein
MRWPSLKPFIIGTDDDPYLKRWFILPHNKWFNIYLHKFCRSDDDRALHDHPWVNMSLLIRGSYLEHMQDGSIVLRSPWWPVFRKAEAAHRVELIAMQPVWTIFVTGRHRRSWGFHCPKGWVHWETFCEVRPGGNAVGKGCE